MTCLSCTNAFFFLNSSIIVHYWASFIVYFLSLLIIHDSFLIVVGINCWNHCCYYRVVENRVKYFLFQWLEPVLRTVYIFLFQFIRKETFNSVEGKTMSSFSGLLINCPIFALLMKICFWKFTLSLDTQLKSFVL